MKKDFLKIYHQQGANLDESDQNIEFIFGKNNDYHQIGNACLQYEKTVEEDEANPDDLILTGVDVIRLLNMALAYCFKEAKLSMTGDGDIEHGKYVGQVSTIMRVLTSKEGDLLSHFDENAEFEAEIDKTLLEHLLINNHGIAADKGERKGQLTSGQIFGLSKTF